MMNGPKHMDLRVIPARQVEGSRLAQSGAFLPLTLTLSRRERGQRTSRRGKPQVLDCARARASFTLSPRERAGMRGNFAKHSLRFKPILGIVEVQAGRLPK